LDLHEPGLRGDCVLRRDGPRTEYARLPLRPINEERGATRGVFLSEFPAGRAKQRKASDERRGSDAMQEMRIAESIGRSKTPLVVKASLPHVFLGLGLFTETLLLFCGSYLLAEAIVQPLDAGTFSVIGGGLLLALATVLLFYLAWPGRKRNMSRREEPAHLRPEVPPLEHAEAVQRQRHANWSAEQKKELAGPI
jgi:hypothetical protein